VAQNRKYLHGIDNMYCGLDYNRYLIYKDLFNKMKYKEEDS